MDKGKLEKLAEEGKSTYQMAAILGVSPTNVRYWLKKLDIGLLRNSDGRYPDGYQQKRSCKCGETNPQKFYGHKTSVCGKCHNEYTKNRGHINRDKSVAYLGGTCQDCEYVGPSYAYDIHHLDPTKKDIRFDQIRGWKWERVKKEIDGCVLLCAICHRTRHFGM